jgi:phage shock protein E
VGILTSFLGPQIPQLDPATAQAKLAEKTKPFLLDVRQPDEYREAHIAGAALIPLGELGHRVHELPRDREIICVCHSGNRSGAATRHLITAGFKASNLSGGMIGWSRAGLPVKKGMAK